MKEKNTPFDDLVRRRLEALPPLAPTAAGWERLESDLDHPEDQLLKKALTGLAPTAPLGWAALERRLDPTAISDAGVADKLNSLQPVAAATAWQTFTSVMDERVASDVDAIVQDKLATNSGGAVTGWAALAARLELIRDRRNRLAAWKITELSLVASLLLLLVRFGPVGEVEKLDTMPIPTQEMATAKAEVASSDKIIASNADQTLLTTTANTATTITANDDNSLVLSGKAPSPGSDDQANGASVNQEQSLAAPGQQKSFIAERLPADAGVIATPLRIDQTGLMGNADAASIVPGMESQSLAVPVVEVERPILLTSSPYEKKVQPASYYLNVFSSPIDINQIITSYIPVYDLDVLADNRFTQGSSAGLLLEINRGRTGVQFGAVYSETSYIPTALKWYLQEDLPVLEPVKGYSRFNYARMEVPFSVNQVFAESKNWRWSARATASLSVIARSSFFVEDEAIVDALNRREQRGATADQFLPGGGSSRNAADRKDVRQLTDPELGIFQGGGLFENSGLYLGGGLMVERLLSPRSSIYFSPTFGRAVYLNPEKIGLGPYQDRIHTGQFRFGARYKLGGDK